jgi:DNA replication ATP-dependent helicase Dna2
MKVSIEKHIEFYKAEYTKQWQYWELYIETQIRLLLTSKEREMYISSIWGIEPNSDLLILKVRNTSKPRINQPYFLAVIGEEASESPKIWTITYKEFRERQTNNFYSGLGEVIIPISIWKSEGDFLFYMCEVLDDNTLMAIKNAALDKGIKPLVLIAESDPPLKYLINLREYLETNPECSLSNIGFSSEQDWKPVSLDNSKDLSGEIYSHIESTHHTIIQGPPGTGKSYFAAQLANQVIVNNKSVLICALANKALVEIAKQEPLKSALTDRKVFKSSLSNIEKKQLPKLQKAESLNPSQGQILLTTYYTLSDFLKNYGEQVNRFDLLIIEEASQAFLATIAFFSKYAKSVLVLGDHKQLPPVVTLEKRQLNKIDSNLDIVINGLKTFALNNSGKSFRLTKTRRLTTAAAKNTGVFYDNSLESISDIQTPISHFNEFQKIFDPMGGQSVVYLPIGLSLLNNEMFLETLTDIVNGLLSVSENVTVGLIAAKRDFEKSLYQHFFAQNTNIDRIHLSTVHRSQGMTVDYCIFFMPLEATHMDLDSNLFNVATSRAKKGTCIITKESFGLMSGVSSEVLSIVSNSVNVTPLFLSLYEKEVDF